MKKRIFILFTFSLIYWMNASAQCTTSLSGSLSGTYSNAVYCITGNVTITSPVIFKDAEFIIAPSTTINVGGGTGSLQIKGCHLHTNDAMWQGIVCTNTGISIDKGDTHDNTLIEDADIAVNITSQLFNYYYYNVGVNIQNTIFNRNRVGISQGFNTTSGNSIELFTLSNDIFTCRSIPFNSGSNNWVKYDDLKMTPIALATPLNQVPNSYSSPYIDDHNFLPSNTPNAYLKLPLGSPPAKSEVGLDFVYGSWLSSGIYRIGNANYDTKTNNTVIFDNQTKGIQIYVNSAIINNCCFQNTPGANPQKETYGILSTADARSTRRLQTNNTNSPHNCFFDCRHAITANYVPFVSLNYNVIRSSKTATNVSNVNGEGFEGIAVNEETMVAPYVNDIQITYNEIANIAYPISFIYDGLHNVMGGTLLKDPISVSYNKIWGALDFKDPTNTYVIPNHFTEQAISLSISNLTSVLPSSTTTAYPLLLCRQNFMRYVHNGLLISGFAGKDLRVGTNQIWLYDIDANTPERNAIRLLGCYPQPLSSIKNNVNNNINLNWMHNMTSVANASSNKYGLVINGGLGFTNQCNFTYDMNSHFRYLSNIVPTRFWDNQCSNNTTKGLQQRGLNIATKGAQIGLQGISTRASNNSYLPTNAWITYGTASYKTYCDNSFATNSPMWVQPTANFNPANSSWGAGVSFAPYSFPNSLYQYTGAPIDNPVCGNNIVFFGIHVTDGGREYDLQVPDWDVMGNYTDDMNVERNADPEQQEMNGIIADVQAGWQDEDADNSLRKYVKLMTIYNYLLQDSSTIASNSIFIDFVQQNNNGSFGTINQIVQKINDSSYTDAALLLTNWQKNNIVDSNYASYFNWLLQYRTDNSISIAPIEALASLCPQSNGNIVFIAQNLYNSVTGEHRQFFADCNTEAEETASKTANIQHPISNIIIYPNPASNYIHIDASKAKQVEIVNILGEVMYSYKALGDKMILPVAQLPRGWYCVKITDTEKKVNTQTIFKN